MTVVINPGSGPVDGHTLADAATNIRKFVEDLGEAWGVERDTQPETDDGSGRYRFTITDGTRRVEIDMPGLHLDLVRYMGNPQNILDFPRLYVDGSSWVWSYALSAAVDQ